MPIYVVAEKQYVVGQPTIVEEVAPEGDFVAIFEDDGTTGYFYAVDISQEEQIIQDAVHIYNVADIVDRELPSTIKVGWSVDNMKAVLIINDYPHAVFDFQAKRGFCRTGFPPPPSNGQWSTEGHAWSESAIKLFA